MPTCPANSSPNAASRYPDRGAQDRLAPSDSGLHRIQGGSGDRSLESGDSDANGALSVVLIDGGRQAREAIIGALCPEGSSAIARVAELSVANAMTHVRRAHVDVAFVDLTVGRAGSGDLLRLTEAAPPIPWIAFVATSDEAAALEGVRCGAAEVLAVSDAGPVLLRATIARAMARADAARRIEERLRNVFDTISSGIVVTDQRGCVVEMNAAAFKHLQVDQPSAAIGSPLSAILPTANGFESRVGASRQEIEVNWADGSTRRIGFSTTETPSGRYRVTALRDLTPILAAERRRRRAEQLALVGEHAALMSHELKNPLASVVAGLQLLERGSALCPQHRAVLAETLTEARRLATTIGDLLDSSREEEIRPEPLDAAEAIEAAARAYLPLAAHRGLSLSITVMAVRGTVLTVDSTSLRRVMANLIINAVEASPARGRISVLAQLVSREEKLLRFPALDGEVLRVLVTDEGPGIPPAVLPHIFTPFFTTKSRGTGLGLATARELVEAHGGRLFARAHKEAPGACLELLLPAGRSRPCWEIISARACEACPVKKANQTQGCWLRRGTHGSCSSSRGCATGASRCPIWASRRLPAVPASLHGDCPEGERTRDEELRKASSRG
jgi:signal transduction histidine kinase